MCRLHIFNLLAVFSDSVEMSQLGNETEQRLCLSVYIIYIYIYISGGTAFAATSSAPRNCLSHCTGQSMVPVTF